MNEYGLAWSNMVPSRFIRNVTKMPNSLGVTIVADEATCAALKQSIPKDIGVVKFISCSYVEKGKCLVIKNQQGW